MKAEVTNAALVTNTSLIEASRLLADASRHKGQHKIARSSTSVRQLLELCNIAECVVLHEHILTLPATYPEHTESVEICERLRTIGASAIILDPRVIEDACKAAFNMLGSIGNNRVYRGVVPNVRAFDFDDFFKRETGTMRYFGNFDDLQIARLESRIYRSEPDLPAPASTEDIMEAAAKLREHLNWNVSPNTDYVMHQIRNFVYWAAAENLNITYVPDAFRTEWARSWTTKWRTSISKEIYDMVAKSFGTQVKEVQRDAEDIEIMLPPIAAIVADRAGNPARFLEELSALREEFSGFRAHFRKLEEDRAHAKSIAERRAIQTQMQALFKSVAAKVEVPERAKLASALGYTGKLLDIIKEPLSPKSYIALAEKGADWVQGWWNAQPAFRLIMMKRRLDNMPTYWRLSRMFVGTEISKHDVAQFGEKYARLLATET